MQQGVRFRNVCQDSEKNKTKARRLFGVCPASPPAILLPSRASFPRRAGSRESSPLRQTDGRTPQAGERGSASTRAPRVNFTHTGDPGEIKAVGSLVAAPHRIMTRPLALSAVGESLRIHRTPQTINRAAWLSPGLQGKHSGERR